MSSDSQVSLATTLRDILGIDLSENISLMESVSIKNLARNQTLFNQGETANNCFLVISGNVKIVAKTNGIESIMTVISQGELGGALLMANLPMVYPGSIVAMTSTCLLLIPKSTFINHWSKNTKVMGFIAACVQNRMRYLQEDKQSQVFDVERRVINFLHRHYIEKKDLISKKVTRKDIALAVGAKTETIIRVLKKLEREGLVKTSRSTIIILDKLSIEQKINNGD